MKNILLLLLSGFLLLAVAGYVAGHTATKHATLAGVYTDLQLLASPADGSASIAHVCQGQITHYYTLQRGVETNPELLKRAAAGLQQSQFFSPGRHTAILSALAGGAGGGVTFRKLARIPKKPALPRKVPRILLIATGMGSGYLVGYQLGYREAHSCDAPERLSQLSNPDFWAPIGSTFVPLWLWNHDIGPTRWQATPHDSRLSNYKIYSPIYFCPFREKQAAAELWERIGSSWTPAQEDLDTLYELAVLLERRRLDPSRNHPFTGCIYEIVKRIGRATKSGLFRDEEGFSHQWKLGDPIPIPSRCIEASGRTEPLVQREYSNLRASQWVSDWCRDEQFGQVTPASIGPTAH